MAADIHRTIETVWRMESARLIAGLARIVRDIDTAEELAQDALVAALERWPSAGIPQNPGAWLMAAAKNRALDHLRRRKLLDRKHEELGSELKERQNTVPDPLPADVQDDLLRLIFTCCHPELSPEGRIALTLRLLGGLTTSEIARAFLVSEPVVAQRIVRAKRTIVQKKIPFEVPQGVELRTRLSSVLEVLYLIFNEGYAATSGDDWTRPDLCMEAMRLGRILAELEPEEPEVHGLIALLELQASRLRARVDKSGNIVRLMDQDRSRWDYVLIRRGLAALDRSRTLSAEPGPYVLQAMIAACHARAQTAEATDWVRIAELYDELSSVSPSPVVELNRASAVAMAHGPAAGLRLVDALAEEPSLRNYYLLPSLRGDLLEKVGRREEAAAAFEHAASLTTNRREREFLLERAKAVVSF